MAPAGDKSDDAAGRDVVGVDAAVRRSTGAVLLVLVTVVWGSTFVVVKDVLDTVPPSLLLALRFSIAFLALSWAKWDRRAIKPGIILGVIFFAASALQTVGISMTSASHAAFITGLSVVLVPVLGALFFGKRLATRVYLAAGTALAGLALITLQGGVGAINGGDLLVLGCAFGFALHIIYLGEVAPGLPATSLAMIQHVPVVVLSWVWAAPEVGMLRHVPVSAYLAVVYLALVATAVVSVVQAHAQRVVEAHAAALIFVLEPVFAAVFAYVLLGERLGAVTIVGAALTLVAMVVAEGKIPAKPFPRFGRR